MKTLKKLARFFLPHKHNNHKPSLFHETSVLIILSLVVVAEFFILSYAFFATQSSYFLSSILPNVLIELTNGNRTNEQVPALRRNAALDRAAQAKADDMARNGYFAHTSPVGIDPWYWILRENYVFARAGENLAVNFYGSSEVVDAWMKSPAHRTNILNEEFSEIGIGIAQGLYKEQNATFVVQMFATPRVTSSVVSQVSSKSETATRNEPEKTEQPVAVLSFAGESMSQAQTAQRVIVASLAASPRSIVNTSLLFMLSVVGAVLLVCAAIEMRRKHWSHVLRGAFLFAVLFGVFIINTFNPFTATLIR